MSPIPEDEVLNSDPHWTRLLAAGLDAAGLGVAFIQADQVVFANPALHALLGYPPQALDGVPWQMLVSDARHLTFERMSALLAERPHETLYYEIRLKGQREDDVIFEVAHRSVELPGFQGQMLTLTPPRRDRVLESAECLAAVCSQCGNIRDDFGDNRGKGKWLPFLDYVSNHELGKITHGLCPDCAAWLLLNK